VAAGTLQLNGGSAIGDLATINLANTPGVTLSITGGNETIGALSGGGASGGSVNLNTAAPLTLTTGANNSSTTFAGSITGGNASLIKIGSGTFTLSGANTYTGATTVNAGKLLLANSLTTSSSVTVASATLEIGAANGSRVLKTGALAVSGTGKINLQDNKTITTSAVGSAAEGVYNGVTGLIQSGRGNGTWNGSIGIVTGQTQATTSNFTSIGI